MPVPAYITAMRARIGHDLLFLTGASGVVFDDAGALLLVRRADTGAWSLPSGMVEAGEQPADAALREIYEETGVEARIERLAGVAMHPVTYPNGDRCEYLGVWFRCRAIGGTARVNDDESVDVAWFPMDSLPDLSGFVRLRIEKALAPDGDAWFAPAGSHFEALTDPLSF
ncbi:MAG TPA: NUDIX domain-containing protein [Micromonosporaceae bacterium]|nr:NUDIX domain-containing protein [Micromonosporaceae bacterium]